MTITGSTLASATGIKILNQRQVATGDYQETAIGIIGTYDPNITTVVDEVPIQVLNEADVGNRTGCGFMLHALAKKVFEVCGGRPVWLIPQSEAGGAAAASGTITFSGTATSAGTYYIRVADELVASLAVAIGDANTVVSAAIDVLINAYTDALVTSSEAAGVVTLTAKSKGPWGNDITIAVNDKTGESDDLPAGLSTVIVDMSAGSGIPTVADALAGLGSGDNKNLIDLTDIVHGYGEDSTTITAIATYVGLGNEAVGLYEDINGRPFRTWYGDVQSGSAGLTAVRAIGDARKTDRTSHLICAPTSVSHPSIIAACACGVAARIGTENPARGLNSQILQGIDPGTTADRWTDTHANRDLAIKSGCATTIVADGVLKLKDVISMYHPDSVSQSSNGYRRTQDLMKTRNILKNLHDEFSSEFWEGAIIVNDKADVTDLTQVQYVRDIQDVNSALFNLVSTWAERGILFDKRYTQAYIESGQAVQLRDSGDGFNFSFPVIYSASSDIKTGIVSFDINLAAILG